MIILLPTDQILHIIIFICDKNVTPSWSNDSEHNHVFHVIIRHLSPHEVVLNVAYVFLQWILWSAARRYSTAIHITVHVCDSLSYMITHCNYIYSYTLKCVVQLFLLVSVPFITISSHFSVEVNLLSYLPWIKYFGLPISITLPSMNQVLWSANLYYVTFHESSTLVC